MHYLEYLCQEGGTVFASAVDFRQKNELIQENKLGCKSTFALALCEM